MSQNNNKTSIHWTSPVAYKDALDLMKDLSPKIKYVGPGPWLNFIKDLQRNKK